MTPKRPFVRHGWELWMHDEAMLGLGCLLGVYVEESISGESMRLESWHSAEEKRRYKIVRTDDYTDIPGRIVTADEATGECFLWVAGESQNLNLGPWGLRIVPRSRTEMAALPPY